MNESGPVSENDDAGVEGATECRSGQVAAAVEVRLGCGRDALLDPVAEAVGRNEHVGGAVARDEGGGVAEPDGVHVREHDRGRSGAALEQALHDDGLVGPHPAEALKVAPEVVGAQARVVPACTWRRLLLGLRVVMRAGCRRDCAH